jgi:LysM repeat protein
MAAKTPKKFRQARKAARADAKKVFSGKTQARLKDKTNPLGKFSADDKQALGETFKEANSKYITDDKGNKIKTNNLTRAEGSKELKRTMEASNEAFRSKMRAEFGEYAGKKATQADYDANPKLKERAPKAAPGKPAPKVTETGKVRSAVTATEVKPQGYKVDKTGKKIKEAKAPTKPGESKAFKSKKTFGQISKAVADKTKAPVVKKGFAAGKELNAEGKAIYDKLVKEGVKPKSALNKALFRQEKGAKVAAKAAAPIAKAAKSAATAVKKQGPVKGMPTKPFKEMTATEKSNFLKGAKPVGVGTMKNGKITFKFNDKEIQSVVEKNRAARAIKVPSTVVSSKPNVPGKELAVRPKAGPAVVKATTASAKKKLTAKGAALGAARLAGKALTGKVGMAVTAASLLGGPVINQLTKDKNRITSADVMKGREQAAIKANAAKQANKSRSNQPRITGQGKLIGKGNIPTMSAGGATSTYRVNAGDTLSGIAKKSGVSLSELLAANKKIKDPRKIYRNTAINIPSKGKVPTGGYAGPVPYRPKKK